MGLTRAPSTRFKQEPDAPFSFINPVLDQTGRRNVAQFVDNPVNLSKASCQRHIVLAQLCQERNW
jgi:hypothetical protein